MKKFVLSNADKSCCSFTPPNCFNWIESGLHTQRKPHQLIKPHKEKKVFFNYWRMPSYSGKWVPFFQQNRWCCGENFVHPTKYFHVVMSGHGANLLLRQFVSKMKKNTECGQCIDYDVITSMVKVKHDLERILNKVWFSNYFCIVTVPIILLLEIHCTTKFHIERHSGWCTCTCICTRSIYLFMNLHAKQTLLHWYNMSFNISTW